MLEHFPKGITVLHSVHRHHFLDVLLLVKQSIARTFRRLSGTLVPLNHADAWGFLSTPATTLVLFEFHVIIPDFL